MTASDVGVLQQLSSWVADTVSAPYPGSGFVRPGGPVCPYTEEALAAGTVLLTVLSGVDGSDPSVLDRALDGALDWFLENVDREQYLHSLVVGLPDVPHTSEAVADAVDRMADKRLRHHVIAVGSFQENHKPLGELEYPDGIPVPVSALVLRYLSPYDNRFLGRSARLLDAFLDRFAAEIEAGTLPPAARRQVVVGCKAFDRPLPPALAGA